jgi:hypothetical protein
MLLVSSAAIQTYSKRLYRTWTADSLPIMLHNVHWVWLPKSLAGPLSL